jgi:Transposase DDE domain
MKNNTLYLPGFHLATLRRKPRSASQLLAEERARIRQHSLSQLGECFMHFIPAKILDLASSGPFSRRRLFSKTNTFWAFFSQVLDADGGCQEVVRKVQAFAAAQSMPAPSASTSAYCQARNKLEQNHLEEILAYTADSLQLRGRSQWWKDRRVVVVDGTGVSMPDTAANQEMWPQLSSQKPGCGFPQARVCACFCLQTGALLSHRIGSRKIQELPLLRQQWETFESGDIFLGDKGFCSYYDVWNFKQRGIDSVITLARRTPVEAASAVKVLGPDDLLIQWPKPAWNKVLSYSKDEWLALPEQLILRQIKVTINTPGFRVKSLYIVTTLTDATTYSTNELADLYYKRWDVELYFRDIKTTMGMDILRCRTPAMIRKEILMYLIAYNAIRLLMFDAAKAVSKLPRQISFKASMQALRQWEPLFNQADLNVRERRRLMSSLRNAIAANILTVRPGRREPRCVKRRPKNFQLLTAPRHEMVEIPHRNRYRAKQA